MAAVAVVVEIVQQADLKLVRVVEAVPMYKKLLA
jgi:hypothetical protein